MTTFINLTPHTIHIMGNIAVSVGPSGQSLRVSQEMNLVHSENGIDFYRANYGSLELVDNDTKKVVSQVPPPVKDNTIYIVSGQCLEAIKGLSGLNGSPRTDFAAPGELVRDDKGQPVGCKGLKIN
jgi:hypothetical protein